MTTSWIAQQLLSLADARPQAPQVPRFNPRPAGVVRPGSASDAVLAVLVSRPDLWTTHAQLLLLSGRTKRAADWALIFLRSQALVEATSDDGRNPRYLRYRITQKGITYATERCKLLAR